MLLLCNKVLVTCRQFNLLTEVEMPGQFTLVINNFELDQIKKDLGRKVWDQVLSCKLASEAKYTVMCYIFESVIEAKIEKAIQDDGDVPED